jgi:tRNA U54 and U55 pseudouridine synthase Pus10
MKPEKKPFVVEFKNRRRQATQPNSIWGAIDLKAASKEVAAKEMAGEVDASTAKQWSDVSVDENITDISV